eukprot:1148168-Pelagomonas_calceolata.AAC.2
MFVCGLVFAEIARGRARLQNRGEGYGAVSAHEGSLAEAKKASVPKPVHLENECKTHKSAQHFRHADTNKAHPRTTT